MHDITASPPTVPTADICDSRDDVQVVAKVFRDFGGNADACGKAVVLCTNNDNSEIKSRLRSPGNGRILVIDNNGHTGRAMVGGNLARWGAENGWAGVIVNGCVRDTHELAAEPIAIKAIGTCPRKSDKGTAHTFEQAARIGKITLTTGVWITMDLDGIVVTPTDPR